MGKYHVEKHYKRLNEEHKAIVRNKYCTQFKCSPQAFYEAKRKESFSVEQLDFFAKVFGIPIGELIAAPLNIGVRPVHEMEQESFNETASKLGLRVG